MPSSIGTGGECPRPSDQKDPQLAEGEQSVKRGDYATAIRLLEAVVPRDQRTSDAYNLLAYSIRGSLGDLARAKEHLAALDKLCFLPCEEYSDLKKAVQEYEATKGRIKPMGKATP